MAQQDQNEAPLVTCSVWQMVRAIRVVFGDSAYNRKGLPAFVKKTHGWPIQPVLRPVKMKGFVVLPKRWVEERTFAPSNSKTDLSVEKTQQRLRTAN